ncbi:PBP1 and LysM peptidoglycan-binding domain-containing protein [Altibacter sp. HG106]|uniref:PBP1 and LysM peptidoglycan-binding domain-containing protein n=1 Tax=Altibacter sp. HG106 TaxID=3023937 RepID=UPI002350DC80|nr:LysM peptidoglycan-binding domain-containing protein [Altibacter sp. HG106]MDC7993994.1 LysM peptidoglycan-binding domain-containing protein [Altibacter sp. HG106]
MRYTLFIALVCVIGMGCGSYSQPSQSTYKTHRVQQGETIYSIAKEYGLSENAIYRLNPDAREGISANSVLILPSTAEKITTEEGRSFKTHRVQRKETLFSIAQEYNTTVDEIKKYNKHLYAAQLKKGEKLQIPVGTKPTVVTDDNSNASNSETSGPVHVVQPKETSFGIARKYGLTLAELRALNPELPENLPIGYTLTVKEEAVVTSAVIEENEFDFYEVQPKEGFYRLKVKLGLSEEEIVALNPYAKNGLKEGMILKIPKENSTETGEALGTIDLERSITNRDTKRLAVMLPFMLNRVTSDSTSQRESILKQQRTVRVALDFYSGVLMAAEFAKDQGISVNLQVFDTEASEQRVRSIIGANNLQNTQAVIGPLLQKNVERAAADLKRDNVPVFSPLSNRNIDLSSNLFQTLPTDDMLKEAMLDYLERNTADKNVLLITDKRHQASKTAVLEIIPQVKSIMPREKGFLYQTDIAGKLDTTGKENWVILESSDPVLVSNVVGLLNGMPETYRLRLFTLDKGDVYDYDDISNMHLANLSFTFPSISKHYQLDEKEPFLVSYKNKYGVMPNRFAVRGFDITYDILLRLASTDDDMYDAVKSDYETEYIGNKFRYNKKFFSGYQNQALYIIRYNKNLDLEVVE